MALRGGQMLHLDGSDHEWSALQPGALQVLLLVAELRLAGIHDLAAANRYIATVFLPKMNGKIA